MVENSDSVDALVLELLDWIGSSPRPYHEVMDAWRTSCPRLPVWEIANERGYVERRREPGLGAVVSLSAAGAAYLSERREPWSA
jgi:hypothetical protein